MRSTGTRTTSEHGRYGDWLREQRRLGALARTLLGYPLPIWRCERGHDTAIGSLNELSELAGRDVTELDPPARASTR